jgi:hypothetical protein
MRATAASRRPRPPTSGCQIGHWKDTTHTGTGFTVTHYDGLWRPVVTERFDAADKAGTWRQAVTRYAPQGGVAFASYPAAGITHYAAAATGTRTHYDALGRPGARRAGFGTRARW